MKTFIATLISFLMMHTAFASDHANLNIKISNPVSENKYFLCLYSIGCLSIKAGNHGKVFHVMPTDIGNIRKIVIADVSNMQMHLQPSAKSCNIKVDKDQKLTITGQLIVKNNTPYINNLHCAVV